MLDADSWAVAVVKMPNNQGWGNSFPLHIWYNRLATDLVKYQKGVWCLNVSVSLSVILSSLSLKWCTLAALLHVFYLTFPTTSLLTASLILHHNITSPAAGMAIIIVWPVLQVYIVAGTTASLTWDWEVTVIFMYLKDWHALPIGQPNLLPSTLAVEVTKTDLFVCVCGFVRPTLCTTSSVQDYIVHHLGIYGTKVQ